MNKHFVYIIQCQDGTLYTGYTTDPVRRFKKHLSGTGAKYTRTHVPQSFVFVQQQITKRQALQLEYKIKTLTRKQKLDFIKNNREAGLLAQKYMGVINGNSN